LIYDVLRELPRKINGVLDAAAAIFEPQLLQENAPVDGAAYGNQEFKPFPHNIDNNVSTSSATISERNRQLVSIKKQDAVINGFNEIYSHESTKNVLNMALKSIKPVHILLVSPPGMAKTQFLLAIRNQFKEKSSFVIGSNSTKKGIIDLLFEKRPQILLIDELETMSFDAQESLLNLMETGILSETKKTCTREMQLQNIKIFATSNNMKDLLSPLLSRFIVLDIPIYTDKQFIEITLQRLTKEEGISEEIATDIAEHVMQKLNRKDLRDCIKIARIAKTSEEIASVISIMN
jgi:Holliday junction resolvasome RuvABC ATP-dependent DNA helicase subunit